MDSIDCALSFFLSFFLSFCLSVSLSLFLCFSLSPFCSSASHSASPIVWIFSSSSSQLKYGHKFTRGTCSCSPLILVLASHHHSEENVVKISKGRGGGRQGRGINSLMISPEPLPQSHVTQSGRNGDISSLRMLGKSNADILFRPGLPHQPITAVAGQAGRHAGGQSRLTF